MSVAHATRLAVTLASLALALPPAGAQTPTTAAAPPAVTPRPAATASGQVLNAEQLQAPRRARPAPVPVSIEVAPRRVMAVGDVATITLQDVTRIAIGNGGLIKATVVDNSQIVLLAEAPGQTTMHVWLRNGRQLAYDVTVQASRPNKVLDDMQGLLKDTPTITARALGERIVLEGRYPNAETALKFKRLSESMPELLNLIADKPSDVDPLQMDRMVQIDLRVIEVKKRALEQLGIKWASSASGPTFATNALGYANTPWRPAAQAGFPPVNTSNPIATYLGIATQITSALQFLEQSGDAWTLAEPRLSCKSGGEASFLAGGEIPIPVPQGLGAVGVEYKQYGVRIDFKPRADGAGNIDSELMVEVSDPDARNSNAGFVAFTTNRTQTQVAMKQGEPLVISGLLRQRNERSGDALPLLGRIPLISLLFGARERTTEQTELFVIATPRVVTPDSVLNRDGVDKAGALTGDSHDRTRHALDKPPLLPELPKAAPPTSEPREN